MCSCDAAAVVVRRRDGEGWLLEQYDARGRKSIAHAQAEERCKLYVHARGREGCSSAGDSTRYSTASASRPKTGGWDWDLKLEAGLHRPILPPLPRLPSAPAKERSRWPARPRAYGRRPVPSGNRQNTARFNRRLYSHAAATAPGATLFHHITLHHSASTLLRPTFASPPGLGTVQAHALLSIIPETSFCCTALPTPSTADFCEDTVAHSNTPSLLTLCSLHSLR